MDPSKRATAAEALALPWFDDYRDEGETTQAETERAQAGMEKHAFEEAPESGGATQAELCRLMRLELRRLRQSPPLPIDG
mmetsp:Transcript_24421/g.79713  ORF Transcript_24421/g.79713 Transcript_24421/m.79713 type:complete len:80 (+) Transcript_24421:204-443(+)